MALRLILGRRSSSSHTVGFKSHVEAEKGGPITYSGDGHLMTFAATGTGKTSGPVICNALRHPGQLIVIDMKGEIHAKTAETRRAMGQEIHVLDLRDDPLPGSLNPLDLLVHSGTDPAAIARNMAADLIERAVEDNSRFWNDSAETQITGGITWLLTDQPEQERRLSALYDLFTCEDADFNMAKLLDAKGAVTNRTARASFCTYLQNPEITRSGILSTTMTHIRLFDSDMVRRLTDTSSMDIGALIAGEPMSIYIIVPPPRLIAYRPLLRLWLSGLILAFTQRATPPRERTLMLCDEIGNLGRIDAFLIASTLLRSFGLTLWSFWQNLGQLQTYGTQANTLVDNAGIVQVFGMRNLRAAQEIAGILGGVSGEELLNLPPDEQILLMEGKLMRCKQVRYYTKDFDEFLAR